MLQAIIFDFDGLIIDTEQSVLASWQGLYREFGHEVPVDQWLKAIGTGYGPHSFDPYQDLEHRLGEALDWDAIKPRRYAAEIAVADTLPPLPGVLALLDDAQAHGVRLAVASSSYHKWVDRHLERLGLRPRFDAVICADDVARIKPFPDLFLKAVEVLGVTAAGTVVLEDSPHGIHAAREAGIFSVAAPNDLTRRLDLSQASMRVQSLAELSVDLLDRALSANHR
jgi:HAD superfamily hydrolase (TIGR01509 family)